MNIKITKSTYKTKENKRAIIYDCSAKNYRKKINTGVFVEDGYLDKSGITLSIALNITLEKLKNKKEVALAKEMGLDISEIPQRSYPIQADTLMASGLLRIAEAARSIWDGSANRTLAHATAGPILQQNLVCVLEGEQD